MKIQVYHPSITYKGQYPTVNTYSDLPSVIDNAGEIYVVLTSTGIYLINRKEAGLYYSNGITWSRLGDIPSFFKDGNFEIYNSSDNSRKIGFDVSGISTSTKRTLAWQNRDGTVALVEYNGYAEFKGNSIADDTVCTVANQIYKFNGTFTAGLSNSDTSTVELDSVNKRIKINANGAAVYRIWLNVSFSTSGAGDMSIRIFKNGNTEIIPRGTEQFPSGNNPHQLSIGGLASLVNGEYIEWYY